MREMRGDGPGARGHLGRMTDLEKFQHACRVFLARLLMGHGEYAPEVLRRMADELEWLEAGRVTESAGEELDPPN
jgi:hypothetical protein